ncbi:MAG: phosphoglucosamine mutase [Solirubrobacteraceae bacterium]
MSRHLFGTDGVRGPAGSFLSAELALALARATVELATEPYPSVLVVRDTRESSQMLEAATAAGVTEAGGSVLLGGVLPTPAASLLVRRYGFDLAVVISASHNPYGDNGIKFFAADGFKLSDETELEVERQLAKPAHGSDRIGAISPLHSAAQDYLLALQDRFSGLDLQGRRVLLDCANGATYKVAPEIFRRLGARVDVMADQPDGRNINDGVGSTHLGAIRQVMAAGDYDVGFAFDGDGDRVLAVDREGQVVDGDELMGLAAVHLKASGLLSGSGVVVTVMTNYGFHTAMAQAGIDVATTAVGDRYVNEELRRLGWRLGGEQSGHIIDLGFGPSGDGIASALMTMEALDGVNLCERRVMRKLPQKLVNIRVASREELAVALQTSSVTQAIASADALLAGRGRVLVRASGTEPLIRVMVEAPDQRETDEICNQLVAVVSAALA